MAGYVTRYETREDWLTAAIDMLRPRFEKINYPLPDVIHVSTGFGPLTRYENKDIRAETYASIANDDGNLSVFVSPYEKDTPQVILVLIHELIHVALDNHDGHTGRFKAIALQLGLVPPLLSLHCTIELEAEALSMAYALGDYPHAGMDKLKDLLAGTAPVPRPGHKPVSDGPRMSSGPRRQAARQIKCWCGDPECGYTVRTTRKWLDVATPICPVHKIDMETER